MEKDELRKGTEYGFIDHNTVALGHYSPKLVTNNYERKEKVIEAIRSELKACDEFMFSVAFITEGGLKGLLLDLEEFQKKGRKGKIIASQYQNFTRPKALKDLLSFDNIEVRIVTEEHKMHTKCYTFRKGKTYNIIIGSSNLTESALSVNEEWNLKISSTEDGEIVREVVKEFNSTFDRAVPVDESWIEQYSKIYEKHFEFRTELERKNYGALDEILYGDRIKPNKMQVAALESIEKLRSEGADRALLISATGTGKTYFSAFDVRKYNPKRLLFLVHREVILTKAMESFRKVLTKDKKIGLLSGNSKDYESDYLFATIQTMSQDQTLKRFAKDYFDYIVFDEAHHVGAKTYQKILDYFNPKFLLGMTATPERPDRFDIFKSFNYNIAYEIRLKEAMEENMISPFHYYGISDLTVDGEVVKEIEDFNKLISDERVKHISDRIQFFGYSGDRVRGLIFCRKTHDETNEAQQLSEKFNRLGYKTAFLTAESSQQERENVIKRLECQDRENGLDYIFVIDLFNEGVDIPSVNQIIMLRPTESPIVFTQQLGRGLRHNDGKEYVVVIDFIGNYDNNYLIPIALSGDTSYKKDNARKFLVEGNNLLPGTSTISFDKIAKERIFAAIDSKDFSKLKIIKEAYTKLKYKLGKVPKLTDFKKFGSIDAMKFIERSGSYYSFLKNYDKEYEVELPEVQSRILEQLSKIICSGKRDYELYFLQLMMSQTEDLVSAFENKMKDNNVIITGQERNNLVAVFTGKFFDKKFDLIEEQDGIYSVSKEFKIMLDSTLTRSMIEDISDLGWENFNSYYSEKYRGSNFSINQKYTYADACRLLNWNKSVNPKNIGGYKYDDVTNTFPIFINYVKGEDVAESQRYEDYFINPGIFIDAPKSTEKKRTAKNLQRVENSESNGMRILLFVRKNKDDKGAKEFYFLGDLKFVDFIDPDTNLMIKYKLVTPVAPEIYDYLVADIDSND